MAELINKELKGFVDHQPLPSKFYARAAHEAALKIHNIAHACFEGELLKKADALVKALDDYGYELEKD
jgi:hypothetical protein